jgi:glucose/arabinose dehydrogenase
VGAGRIFCGDVGQNRFEEIDIIEKGGNYGWRAYEGFECYDRRLCSNELQSKSKFPIHAYSHSVGQSVTGGYVYRGCQFPRLQGQYIYGDFVQGKLFALKQSGENGTWVNREVCFGSRKVCHDGLATGPLNYILSFAQDEDGEVYVLVTSSASVSSASGSLIQLIDPSLRANPSKCKLTRKIPAP